MSFDNIRGQIGRVRVFYRGWMLALLLGLLTTAYVGGCMVGHEQERDLQRMREQACKQDPHCLHP
ncbi:MAG: hypothetical protein H6R19_1458 [Proteobacteria bacterium]|nr:hypothetical protein [Pseudomonadota bacterium]